MRSSCWWPEKVSGRSVPSCVAPGPRLARAGARHPKGRGILLDRRLGFAGNRSLCESAIDGNTTAVAEGQTVTIDDGTNPPTVLEFDDDESVAAGHVQVEIGPGAKATMANLVAAINGVGASLMPRAQWCNTGGKWA